MSEEMKEEERKAMMNTLVECKVLLKEHGELIRKLPTGQSPVIKEFAKRMEELENNTKEEGANLVVVSKNIEGTGKYLWDSVKKVEKIQTGFEDFSEASRRRFEDFATSSERRFYEFVQENFQAMTLMQKLCKDLKVEILNFQESQTNTLIGIIVGLFLLLGAFAVWLFIH